MRNSSGCGLYAMGFRDFDRSAVFAPNRPRWIFSAIAPLFLRGAMVPIYPTSKPDDLVMGFDELIELGRQNYICLWPAEAGTHIISCH